MCARSVSSAGSTTCSRAFIRRVVRAISSASRRIDSSSAATSSSFSSTASKRSATASMRALVAVEAVAASGASASDRRRLDLDDRDAGHAARAHAHLDVALGGQCRGRNRLGAGGGDREPELPAGVAGIAVEHLDRLQRRGAEPVELVHERAAPLLEQIPALAGEPDPGPPGEQFAARRADLLHHHAPLGDHVRHHHQSAPETDEFRWGRALTSRGSRLRARAGR